MRSEHPVHMDGALHPCGVSTPFIWTELSIHTEGALPSYRWSSPSIRTEHPVHMNEALHPYERSTPSTPTQRSIRLTEALAPCRVPPQIDREALSRQSACGRHASRWSPPTFFSSRFAKPPAPGITGMRG